jgi:hypothetical protein
MRRCLLSVFAVVVLLPGQAPAQGCCGSWRPQSLLDRFGEAPMVMVGRLQNAVKPNNALPDGQVELVLDDVLIPHATLKGRRSILLPRHREASAQKLLVAVDIFKGQLDPYFAEPLDDKGEIVKYVIGGLPLKDKPRERARYNVEFLRSANVMVAYSALVELERIEYKELRKLAETQKPEPWLQGLQDGSRPKHADMYAMLLAHCGKPEDARLVRKLIDDRDNPGGSTGLMFAYVMLDKKNGWSFVAKWASDAKNPFLKRYAALNTMRLFVDERTDVIDTKRGLDGIAGVVHTPDMADFAIEDMRKRKRWEYCATILDLHGKQGYETAVIQRSILRYALQCPSPVAKTFVLIERARDPEFVSETEEILQLYAQSENPQEKQKR